MAKPIDATYIVNTVTDWQWQEEKETIEIDINRNVYGYYVLSTYVGGLYFEKKYDTNQDCLKLFKQSINNEIFINNFNIYDCEIIVNNNTMTKLKGEQ